MELRDKLVKERSMGFKKTKISSNTQIRKVTVSRAQILGEISQLKKSWFFVS